MATPLAPKGGVEGRGGRGNIFLRVGLDPQKWVRKDTEKWSTEVTQPPTGGGTPLRGERLKRGQESPWSCNVVGNDLPKEREVGLAELYFQLQFKDRHAILEV